MNFRRALLALLVFAGCTCDDKIVDTTGPCERKCASTADCQLCGYNRHECVDGVCVEQPRSCGAEGDCCPGETCNQVKICADRFTECRKDEDCSVPGQVCRAFITFRNTEALRCTFELCGAAEACGPGTSCFGGYCVGTEAFIGSGTRLCNGGCAAGEVCVPVNGRCMKPPPECQIQTCGPGMALVFEDPRNVDDDCDLTKRQCVCDELPPLVSNDVGRYSAVAAGDQEVLVSAYDGTYGDLVLLHFDAAGTRLGIDYVDGVPATGVVVAAPSGPRKGVSDPGEDVGRYTDIALDAAGQPYISYYDTTHGDLKIAYFAGGAWHVHTVDGDTPAADVGLYSSIALVGGKPAIAYFQRAGTESQELRTALRFAWATSATPQSSADWNVKTIDQADRPAPPCFAPKCTADEVCVEGVAGTNGVCKARATGCDPECKPTEQCVTATGSPRCEKVLVASTLADLPEGVGLMPSLVEQAGGPVIAYYDRLKGALKAAKGDQNGVFPAQSAIPYLDGKTDSSTDLFDVGLFPSALVKGDGSLAIAYQDATRDALLYWTAPAPVANVPPTLIDDGNSEPGSGDLRIVGADAALVATPGGAIYVAYQDSTASNLRIRKLDGSAWTMVREVSEGAVGFFADAAARNGKLYVSHVKIKATPSGLEETVLLERLEAP